MSDTTTRSVDAQILDMVLYILESHEWSPYTGPDSTNLSNLLLVGLSHSRRERLRDALMENTGCTAITSWEQTEGRTKDEVIDLVTRTRDSLS